MGYLFADINEGFAEKSLDISNFAYSTSAILGLSYKITDSWTAAYGDFKYNMEDLNIKYEKPVLHELKLSARYYF